MQQDPYTALWRIDEPRTKAMKKPIANMYTIIWVEVPDAPTQRGPARPGKPRWFACAM